MCHGIDPGSQRLRLLNVGTFPSTCSPSFLSRLCSSCGQYVTTFSSRMWSVVALQTSITIMFDQEHIGNIVFWEVGFQKSNLSTSTGHLEVGLNDMWGPISLSSGALLLIALVLTSSKKLCPVPSGLAPYLWSEGWKNNPLDVTGAPAIQTSHLTYLINHVLKGIKGFWLTPR